MRRVTGGWAWGAWGLAVWVAAAGVGEERRPRGDGIPAARRADAGRYPAGFLLGASTETSRRWYLPLRSTRVRLEVVPGLVEAEVEQVFVNDTETALEAVYVHPLPGEAVVTDMELQVGARRIRSVVRRRDEAREHYEKARAEGRRAALVEQERPNLFTTSVANILPGDTVTVRFAYVERIEYRWGVYTTTFPMTVGPRYIPRPPDETGDPGQTAAEVEAEARRLSPPLLPPGVDPGRRVDLQAVVRGFPLREVRSPTHALRVEAVPDEPGAVQVVPAEGPLLPDGDFQLDLLLDGAEPQGTCVACSNDRFTHLLLSLFPPVASPAQAAAPAPRAVVFVIDTSGSMSGESIRQARAGLLACLEMLTPRDVFTVIRFSDDLSSFSESLVPATPRNLALARRYGERLRAGGGTEMLPALQRAVELTAEAGDALPMILFLTDGCVMNERDILRMLGQRLRTERLFTFGIGSAPNEHFLRRMAEIGRGQYRCIRSLDQVGEVLAEFFATLNAPVLTDVSVRWEDATGREAEGIVSYPDPLPDVFAGRPLHITARVPRDLVGRVAVRGQANGRTLSYAWEVPGGSTESVEAVEKLFGRARLDRLLDEHLYVESEVETAVLKQAIIETALEYQLLSPYTARVAVEEIVARGPDGAWVTVNVPTMLPRGWDAAAFFGTATADPAWFASGGVAMLLGFWMVRALRTRRPGGAS